MTFESKYEGLSRLREGDSSPDVDGFINSADFIEAAKEFLIDNKDKFKGRMNPIDSALNELFKYCSTGVADFAGPDAARAYRDEIADKCDEVMDSVMEHYAPPGTPKEELPVSQHSLSGPGSMSAFDYEESRWNTAFRQIDNIIKNTGDRGIKEALGGVRELLEEIRDDYLSEIEMDE